MSTRVRRQTTLTRRVVWAVSATVAVLTGLQALLSFFAMHAQEDEFTDDMLHQEVQQLTVLILRPGLMPVGSLEATSRVTAYLVRGTQGVDVLPTPLRSLEPGLYQLTPEGHTWHVAVLDTDDGRLSVVLDATESEERVVRFGLTMLALWLLCVTAAVFVARGVAALAVQPIVEATRRIASIAPGSGEAVPAPADEAGILMETFNRFRDQMDETVAREREFAANLEHEIRTPLTAIRTDAELIGLEGETSAGQRLRLERIAAAVDEITATTEALLAAGSGGRAATAPVDLRACVASACEALAGRAGSQQLKLVNEVARDASIAIDRQALLTVCRNVIRNAIEHAAPATLTIGGDRDGLRFRDDGPGIAAAALPHVFERYHRGHRRDDRAPRTADESPDASMRRRGLGLAIARRLCDLHGWQFGVASPVAHGRGTEFRLDFAAPP